jgi:hypothetical protein
MQEQNYAKGRAGELVTRANRETFDLIKEIFGKNGPYRRVLYRFGIGNPYIKTDFIVLKEDIVLTDINEENRILWESIMYKLVKNGDQAQLIPDFTVTNFLVNGTGLIKKVLIDAWIILNINGYIFNAKRRYKKYSDFTQKVLEEKKIDRREFLQQYEHVVYVTYLFELLFEYNKSTRKKNTGAINENECLKEYVKRNDRLLNYDLTYNEFKYKNVEGFSLGETEKNALFDEKGNEELNLIPGTLEECDCEVPKLIRYEKELQCLKDNMRLKTQTQLFVMNYQPKLS